MMVPTVYSPWV